ncbi:hypothetical protein HGRIS_005773 [Hohenbuehelia grisea]|uniref:Midasin n=1 Tax=Hohenbuehelia grisea TaxID=104357 RepID=A0ABR3JZA8_9AGAR
MYRNRSGDVDIPRKRRKVEDGRLDTSESAWSSFESQVSEFEVQHVHGKGKFAFGFVEGPLVKALRNGDWVLLDEVNLASAETLECVSGLLHGPTASITLTEQGSLEPVPRHPDFRLFACMNPATDVGKKDLPPNIRMRFTEIDVPPPDADRETLLNIVTQYIGHVALGDKAAIMNVAEFYAAVKHLSETRQIADGANHRPHYSMRTLARALTFAADIASAYGLRRAIWEGCLMAFTMVLDAPSAQMVTELAKKHLLAGVRNPRSMLANEPSRPQSGEYIKLGAFYLERGPLPEDLVEDYIMTPSVEEKLKDLARIILTRRFPVLIEGPTSSGKTSSVEYLAKRTGHRFIRINNHEHTDIQEYLGSYVSDPITGKLVFKDGLLVQALRRGDWIVLDELNLAPSDVLEALNRLLDDNRELVIPETHEVVKPHPHFMLFATQNPPGLYAGRKVLSRAFRNRFLEVHFEDVPQAELESILCQRCRIAPSYGKRIVTVFRELQQRRQSGRVFESKQGFATLRDLFRWAGRDALGYQELADNGYMLLAERARRADDKTAVKEVIESVMGVKIDEQALYGLNSDSESFLGCPVPQSSQLVWTSAMKRLFILVARALKFNEPVLLVGETGSGKTSVCQVYADGVGKQLHGLNCHQNTETADLIGGLRPVRNRSAMETETLQETADLLQRLGTACETHSSESMLASVTSLLRSTAELPSSTISELTECRQKLVRLASIFEWKDGPLVQAMRCGDVFLLDEISLADDSVLERLNSVLEPSRTIVLAERGGDDTELPSIRAAEEFKLIATMNPGGDYGKKELSPALRNRFTEIWVPPVVEREDLQLIVDTLWKYEDLKPYSTKILDFTEWLSARVGDRALTSLRDILAWINFSNSAYHQTEHDSMPTEEVFHHAAYMTIIDGLGSLPQLAAYTPDSIRQLRHECTLQLQKLAPLPTQDGTLSHVPVHDPSRFFQLGSFAIPMGPNTSAPQPFSLQTPTTQDNAMRVIRACQVPKPILLEGSPGVGKTSLVTALAGISGHHLCRINLSDQTDLIDLFGADLPAEGGGPGEFTWKDAEFLTALQDGHWVLLDEMNLAPQAVLEGLNAVLDHRGTVYIPELGRTFTRHPDFRIFAAQNPLSQGGGRKGLPKSFVNRFTKVYVEELTPQDLLLVCQMLFPQSDHDIMKAMISYNSHLSSEVATKRSFARDGAPWEFNLRDILRWTSLVHLDDEPRHPLAFISSIYLHRFRTVSDRERARSMFDQIFSTDSISVNDIPRTLVSSEYVQIGHFNSSRYNYSSPKRPSRLLQAQSPVLESLGHCVRQNWLAIVTGPRGSGKTEAIRFLAHTTGHILHEISVNSATDTMDLLGSFEQMDTSARLLSQLERFLSRLRSHARCREGTSRSIAHCVDKLYTATRSTPAHPFIDFQSISSLLSQFSFISQLETERLALILELDQFSKANQGGRFEWVDGPLIQAAKEGHWLLIDGANLCNPSVLDRLNSLCEPNGVLTLSERGHVNGLVQTIRPHPTFRLFMSVDPQLGELSRAMRNRGVEISIVSDHAANDARILLDYLRLPIHMDINEHPAQVCLLFDAFRRGIANVKVEPSVDISSSGRALDQNSALCDLTDKAPQVEISHGNQDSPLTVEAMLYFHVRTATAYPSLYNRFINSIDFNHSASFNAIVSYSSSDFARQFSFIVNTLRTLYTQTWKVPTHFSSTLPNESLINNPSPRHTVSRPNIVYACQALDLVVALFLDQQESGVLQPSRRPIDDPSPSASFGRQAYRDIGTVLSTAHTAIWNAVSELNLHSIGQADDDTLTVSYEILRFTRPLRRAISTTTFDFSAVQAISKWLLNLLSDAPPGFVTLVEAVQKLADTMVLSSGLGLSDIWTAFYLPRCPDPYLQMIQRLDVASTALSYGPKLPGLRKSALEIMALHALPGRQDLGALQPLAEQLNKLAHENGSPAIVSSSPTFLTNPAELSILTTCCSEGIASEALEPLIRDVLSIAYNEAFCPMRRLIPYQHLIWAAKENQVTLSLTVRLHLGWYNHLWEASNGSHPSSSPSMLLRPTMLTSTFTSCHWTRNTLSSLPVYEAALERHLGLILFEFGTNTPRLCQLVCLWISSVLLICSCFATSFNEGDLAEMKRLAHSTDQIDLDRFMTLALQTSNVVLVGALQRTAIPAFSRLRQARSLTRQDTIAALGVCWVSVARLLLELFVPDAPVDPLAVRNFAHILCRDQEDLLQAQITLHRQLDSITSVQSENTINKYLKDCLDAITAQHPSDAKDLSHCIARDPTRLEMFWSEVNQFLHNVISPKRIDQLVKQLELEGETGALQANVVQQSIAGFSQRLDAAYSEYDDIALGVQLALGQLRFGLSLMEHASVPSGDECALATALVAFPSIQSTDLLVSDPTSRVPSGFQATQSVLLSLAAFGARIGLGVEIDTLAIDARYSQALHLWLIDRAKEAEAEKAGQSLYRRNVDTYDAASEVAIEEQEFLALFPSFDDVLERAGGDRISEAKGTQHISLLDMYKLVDIHHLILAPEHSQNTSFNLYSDLRKSALESLLRSHAQSLPETLDGDSLILQLLVVQAEKVALQGTTKPSSTYNFYSDPNVPEAIRARDSLQSLIARLEALIQEWPDQMVLQDLKRRCVATLELDLHSPVAMVLSAFEQILLQSEDWEIYASKATTLREHQHVFANIIVDWRRLELSSWPGLLESELRASSEHSSEWWFRLYNSLVRGLADALGGEADGEADAVTIYLRNLIPLLDDFIRTSPLGQFQPRMKLLQSFEHFVARLAGRLQESLYRTNLLRVQHMLHHTYQHFALFSATLSEYLSQQRNALEKDIKALIKLASWKDINVHALKQSAQRSHHQLFKIIRKFREVLREPVSPKLLPDMSGRSVMASSEPRYATSTPPITVSPSFPPVSTTSLGQHLTDLDRTFTRYRTLINSHSFPPVSTTSLGQHLTDLDRTFTRYRTLINSHINDTLKTLSSEPIEDFATEIITTAHELSTASVGSSSEPTLRQKHQKALLVRKRKAWSDLLKELKRAGFSSAVKPDVLQRQTDLEWIRTQPILQSSGLTAAPGCELYFHRLVGCLPTLRATLVNPHSDVATRDLQRALMFVESGFSMALDARNRLVQSIPRYSTLGCLTRRLRMINSCPTIVSSGEALLTTLKHLKDRLLLLANAMKELTDSLQSLLTVQHSAELQECAVHMQLLLGTTQEHGNHLATIVDDVDLTTPSLLLKVEYDAVVQIVRHLQDVTSSLSDWARRDTSAKRLLQATRQWLDSQPAIHIPITTPSALPDSQDKADRTINALLVTVQDILKGSPPTLPARDDDRNHYLRDDYHAIRNLTQLLDIASLVDRLSATLTHLADMPPESCLQCTQRLLPFVTVYEYLAEAQLNAHSQWTKALFKLNYVLVSLTNTLGTQGFCKPPDMDDSGEGGESNEVADGVGFGEGSGADNVSKEIEEEHQVEGLQGDDQADDSEAREQTDDSNAIEMSEDVGGEMEDVPDPGSEDEEGEEEENDDQGPEEQLGNLDKSDPAAVDEKLWGDEKGPEADGADDKVDQDRSQDKPGDSEMVAKEGPQSKRDRKDGDTDTEPPEAEPAAEETNPDEDPLDEGVDEADTEPPNAQGAPMDEHVQDADTLDLPDDLNINLDEQDPGDAGMDIDDEPDDTMEGMQEPISEPEELGTEDFDSRPPEDAPAEQTGDAESEEKDDNMGMEDTRDEEGADGDGPENEAIGQADISSGDGLANAEQAAANSGGEAKSSDDSSQVKSHAGQEASTKEESKPDADSAQSEPQQSNVDNQAQPANSDSDNAGSATTGAQRGSAPSDFNAPLESNPLRSLADTLNEIKQRLEPILDAAQANSDAHQERLGDTGTTSQLEYLQPDAADHEMQALGPAGEEEVAKLNELKLVDDEHEHEQAGAAMDVDPHFDPEQPSSDPHQAFEGEPTLSNPNPNIDSAVTGSGRRDALQGSTSNTASQQLAPSNVDDENAPDDAAVELELREWQSAQQPEQAKERIWHLYESLTSDLAHALCEQLRLILEPTLATRLKGDYRTGKRLNMKKVISYIASDYTKDKIWLRRTRPSQREYQVLIALDDSRSMAESHSVHLAFQTLALVSKALSRLEAGDIGIARFGETVDILHGFDAGPFSDQAGSKVLNAFKFDQKSTNVLSLLQRSLQTLESARERRSMSSGTAADLWQLEIIISDGICQDHEQLRTVLRKAEEQRVMIVFIIIDSLHPAASSSGSAPSTTDSILSMPRAVSKMVNGRMEVDIERYLDSFPFEYYVVLRNVEALPDVLAGTLKQFFERISEE